MINNNTLVKLKWLVNLPFNVMAAFIYTYSRSNYYRYFFFPTVKSFYADLFLTLRGPTYIDLGNCFRAGRNLWLECLPGDNDNPLLTIGNHFTASNNVHIACSNRVTIGDGVLVGSNVLITDHSHGRYHGFPSSKPSCPPILRPIYSPGPVEIGDNVWIGDNVVVLPNVRIGNGCVIGASSVVTSDIEENTIACGIPARPIKRYSTISHSWELID